MLENCRPRVRVLGVEIDNFSFAEAIGAVFELARSRRPAIVVTPNVDHVMTVRRDPAFRGVYDEADLILADGVPLLWAARLLGHPLQEKVSGSDLLPRFCEAAASKEISVYLFGGKPGAADKCAARLKERYPGLAIAGVSCPPYGFEKDPERNTREIEAIRAAKPDVLFVALGTPKQEYWLRDNRDVHGVPVSIGVGASIDFIAGAAKRAPRWMQKSGMEWIYRLCHEPRRLWKRYLIQDSPFVFLALREVIRRRLLRRG